MVHDAVAPVQLSYNARTVAANPKGTRLRGVTGPAGSGKTFALTARAARLAGEGKSVLVLCFNQTLANRLRRLVADRCAEYGANPTRVVCTSFHPFCARIVDDAVAAGIEIPEPSTGTWPVRTVEKARRAFGLGFEHRVDAVLVDEGQDFTLDWWALLRDHVVRPDGEMLLAADSTVELYGNQSWADAAVRDAAGFTDPWIELETSYRMAPDLLDATNLFATEFLADDGAPVLSAAAGDQEAVVGALSTSFRQWRNAARVADLGREMGRAVVDLLRGHPDLKPSDVVYLCEYHHDGLAAAAEIEAAGHPVHHVFSRDPDARHQRKARFWPDADAVKGCTVHSFKGWESPAVVLGIGVEARSRRIAYASMTRVASTLGTERSYLVVVNADRKLAGFGDTFELGAPVTLDG
jgi:superfamily I DNA/RNA helicase